MSEAVLVALITGGLTLAGTILTVAFSHRSTLAALDKKTEVSDERIHGEINTMKSELQGEINVMKTELQGEINVIMTDIKTLSERVDVHNNLIDRTYKLEEHAKVTDERLKHLGDDGK